MKQLSFYGLLAGLGLVAAGCAERRPATVYQPAPVIQSQPVPVPEPQPQQVYVYPQQSDYPAAPNGQSPPLVTQYPPGVDPGAQQQAPILTAPPQGQAAPQAVPQQQVVVQQPPPPPQVEVIPPAPGPDYAWAPGYWTWNGGWIWVGGGWVHRPRPYAVWIGPRWEHRPHGYVWRGGQWR